MNSIEIKIEIDGEIKTFTCTKVKGILLRKTAEIMKTFEKMAGEFNEENLDKLVDYVVEVFNKQFTREQFYDGIQLDEIVFSIQSVANQIMEMATVKIKN